VQAPNLQISKVANVTEARPGDTVTYTTRITNPQRSANDPLGPTATATNVTISDPLPSGLHFAGFVEYRAPSPAVMTRRSSFPRRRLLSQSRPIWGW
jgi:hypothetical protein